MAHTGLAAFTIGREEECQVRTGSITPTPAHRSDLPTQQLAVLRAAPWRALNYSAFAINESILLLRISRISTTLLTKDLADTRSASSRGLLQVLVTVGLRRRAPGLWS